MAAVEQRARVAADMRVVRIGGSSSVCWRAALGCMSAHRYMRHFVAGLRRRSCRKWPLIALYGRCSLLGDGDLAVRARQRASCTLAGARGWLGPVGGACTDLRAFGLTKGAKPQGRVKTVVCGAEALPFSSCAMTERVFWP